MHCRSGEVHRLGFHYPHHENLRHDTSTNTATQGCYLVKIYSKFARIRSDIVDRYASILDMLHATLQGSLDNLHFIPALENMDDLPYMSVIARLRDKCQVWVLIGDQKHTHGRV
jgi:hypothetical protein